MAGEVEIGKCKKDDGSNFMSMFDECVARGLLLVPMKDRNKYIDVRDTSLNYTKVTRMNRLDVVMRWQEKNPGRVVPDYVQRTFKPVSNATFIVVHK
jgi:hypothetical protein